MRLGITELIFIFCIILIIFGPTKLPQLGKSLGQAIRNFKSGMDNAAVAAEDDGTVKNEE